MAETKFTPGPWSVWRGVSYRDASGERMEYPIHVGEARAVGNQLAVVRMGGPGALHSDAESVRANAALIAAAPDLYEAADEVDEFGLTIPLEGADEKVVPVYMTIGTVKKFRAALLKARGEQP